MPASPHSPQFRKALDSIVQGDVIIAPLRAYLMDPEFKGFEIDVHGIGRRSPDGMFHPSSHPGLPDRVLWLYLVHPELLIEDPIDPMGVLSMTAGSVWHAIIERALMDLGLLEIYRDGRGHPTAERAFHDPKTGATGKVDGIMRPSQFRPDLFPEVFEFKTAKDLRVVKLTCVEDYIAAYPTYFLQAQEYLRLTGLQQERVLIMALTYPYEMREFIIKADPYVQHEIEQKYLRVRQAVAEGWVPQCDGCEKKAHCPARGFCLEAAK